MIFQFGVEISQNDRGAFTASLVDLPDAPRGEGISATAAQEQLIASAADAMTQFLVAGRVPAPLARTDGAFIGLSLPQKIVALGPDTQSQGPATFFGKREGGGMMTYSWRNNSFMTEG